MAKARKAVRLVAGCLLLLGLVAPAGAAPTVAQMLSWYKPKQEGIVITTPTPDEQKTCQVQPVKGSRPGSVNGWQLVDGQGRLLRRFYDSNGDEKQSAQKRINAWSYFKDGVEVYRELDTTGTGAPNQYRWLNSAGMKWGVDLNADGKIDAWRMISAEEVCQEMFQALAANDVNRFKALLVSETDLGSLKLTAGEAERVRKLAAAAAARFQELAAKLPAKAQYGSVESAAPQCAPAGTLGADADVLKYASRTLRYDYGEKQYGWLQTGEMLRVGLAWRLVDGPTDKVDNAGDPAASTNPEVDALLKQLAELDRQSPPAAQTDAARAEVRAYNLKRVEVLERILAKAKAEERETWLKQIADCLNAAAQNSPANDNSSFERLSQFRQQVAREHPGSGLDAYVTYRELWAKFYPKVQEGDKDALKAQKEWLDQLTKFVQNYPQAEDTPDALMQLGQGCELLGEEGQAKKWYQQLAGNFAGHPLAPRAKGSVARLDLVGNVLELSGPTLEGGQYNITQSRGKVVVVYYWSSISQQCAHDFTKLKLLLANTGAKGVELVCVNLDDNKEDAVAFLKKQDLQAVQLYQPGGINGALATQYGIMGPPNLFLVGKDGKCVSRTVPINDLEDEVRKLLK